MHVLRDSLADHELLRCIDHDDRRQQVCRLGISVQYDILALDDPIARLRRLRMVRQEDGDHQL